MLKKPEKSGSVSSQSAPAISWLVLLTSRRQRGLKLRTETDVTYHGGHNDYQPEFYFHQDFPQRITGILQKTLEFG